MDLLCLKVLRLYIVGVLQRMPSLYAPRRELLFPSDSVEATRPNMTKLKRLTHRHVGKEAFCCCEREFLPYE